MGWINSPIYSSHFEILLSPHGHGDEEEEEDATSGSADVVVQAWTTAFGCCRLGPVVRARGGLGTPPASGRGGSPDLSTEALHCAVVDTDGAALTSVAT